MIKVDDHSAVIYNSRNIIIILHEDIYDKNWHTFDFYFNTEFVPNGFISLHANWEGKILGESASGRKVLAGKVIKPYYINEKVDQDQEICEAIESSLTDDDSYVRGDTYCCILGPHSTMKNILSKLSRIEEKYTKIFEANSNFPPATID